MAASSDDEGEYFYHAFGTPVEQEVETRAGRRHKDVRDPAATRALPLHKQEVTDEQGRRRFHGAFTGGFSAGYYNTVGSKEGWAPSSFRSSRDSRSSVKQSVEQFLDEDELQELRGTSLQTTADYDTFGSTAAELARRAVAEEVQTRPSAIPGLLPDELVAPVADSWGVRLLQRMGWRQGKGIGGVEADDEAAAAEQEGEGGSRRRRRHWGRPAGVGPDNTPLHLLQPKNDAHGLGYDPFKGAEEFRAAKQQHQATGARAGQRSGAKRTRGIAFGSGVLDEDDAEGILEDYVTHDDVESYDHEAADLGGLSMKRGPRLNKSGLGDRLARRGYTFEITEEGEDEEQGPGLLGWRGGQQQYALPGREAPLLLQSKEHAASRGMIPGFTRATAVYTPPYFPPPCLPPGYMPRHHAAPAAGAAAAPNAAAPAPPQAQPPADAQLHRAIDSLALYVARNGPLVEAVARERQRREGGRQAFLLGGEGAAYYAWRLHSLRSLPGMQRRPGGGAFPLRAIGQRSAPLTADERGALLGEAPLPSSAPSRRAGPGAAPLPFGPGVMQPAEAAERPGQEPTLRRQLLQVAEADRTRLQSLLKRSFVSGSTQELLQPNAAASAGLRPGAAPAPPRRAVGPETAGGERPAAYTAAGATAPSRIVTAADLSRPLPEAPTGAASAATAGLPVRRSEEWRPAPLLCKRFNVPDPYHGRPAEVQHSRFKTDHLALPDTAARVVGAVAAAAPGAEAFLLPPSVAAAIEQAQQQQQGLGGPLLPGRQVPAAPAAEQQQAEQPSMGEPQDAAGAADAFLSSLAGMLEAPPASAEQPPPLPLLPAEPADDAPLLPPEQGAAAVPAEAVAEPVTERPLDLFKAIFEASDDEDEVDEKATGSGMVDQQQQQQAPPAPLPLGVPPAVVQQQQAAAQVRDAFGFAKLRRPDELPPLPADTGPAAAAGPTTGEVAAAQSPLPAQAVAQQGQQFDDAMRARVEEALRNLKRHKKRKKEKKDKRSKSKHKKEHKGKRPHKERRSRRTGGSDSSGDSTSKTDSD